MVPTAPPRSVGPRPSVRLAATPPAVAAVSHAPRNAAVAPPVTPVVATPVARTASGPPVLPARTALTVRSATPALPATTAPPGRNVPGPTETTVRRTTGTTARRAPN